MSQTQPEATILELQNISKSYGGALALTEVDFHLLPGEVHGLVGENGAGKTTLIKLLARFYDPTDGEILLDGRDLR
ncbi:MAG: ATP-binding cassette domain-containing protein, partial [Caldilineaceae bacterium]|nr:ATP-binding cassette domain-containing protein [Caldilineaceae bacterium]